MASPETVDWLAVYLGVGLVVNFISLVIVRPRAYAHHLLLFMVGTITLWPVCAIIGGVHAMVEAEERGDG